MTFPTRLTITVAAGLGALFTCSNPVYAADAETVVASSIRAPRAEAPVRTRPTAPVADVREVLETPLWGRVSGDMVNVRSGAGTPFPIITTLRGGDYVRIMARQGGWMEIQWPEQASAWIAQDFVKPDGTVTGNNVRVRAAGNLNAAVLAELDRGSRVEVLGTSGNWYRVKAPASARAFIFGKYVISGVRAPSGTEALPAAPEPPATQPNTPPIIETDPEPVAGTQAPAPAPAEPETARRDRLAEDLSPAPQLPAMDLSAHAAIELPQGEAACAERAPVNLAAMIESLPNSTGGEPQFATESLFVAPPAPVETPTAPAAPPVSQATTPAPVEVTEAPAAPQPPVPAPKQARVPEEENLWGDELPPPRRVTLPPGTRRDDASESSDAGSTAPAASEGGLVLGLMKLAAEQYSFTAERADVVELPQTEVIAPEEAQTPEPQAPVRMLWPRMVRQPVLPAPATSAPAAIRLPIAHASPLNALEPMASRTVDGLLEAAPSAPVKQASYLLREADGTVWWLVESQEGHLAALAGQRVQVSGGSQHLNLHAPCNILTVHAVFVLP